MKYVSATDAEQRLAALLEAAQSEPVVIQRQNRDIAVLLRRRSSAVCTPRMLRLSGFCDRVAAGAQSRGMTEDKLAAMLADDE